jgi:hypothetical protein
MKNPANAVLAALCTLALTGSWSMPARAQTPEVKEKPPLYTYVANWTIPRAHWADVAKQDAADDKVFDKAIAGGSLVGYGADENLVHQADGDTHDTFWTAMSMAGVLSVLDDLQKSGATVAGVLASATKHSDNLFVSRYYNWKAGTVKSAYTHGASYKLKPTAPDEAIGLLSKAFVVPLFEKLLAEGTVVEYEVDEEAIHTEAPGTFWIFYITPTAAGLDKVMAALDAAFSGNSFAGPALDSLVDPAPHRDMLARTNATYK